MAKAKKVVVLGLSPDRQAVLEFELNDILKKDKKSCSVVFAHSPQVAFGIAGEADVVVANVDISGDFFEKLFERGYSGHIVPMTSRRSQMSKCIEVPGKKPVFPTSCRGALFEILKALNKAAALESKEEIVAD